MRNLHTKYPEKILKTDRVIKVLSCEKSLFYWLFPLFFSDFDGFSQVFYYFLEQGDCLNQFFFSHVLVHYI